MLIAESRPRNLKWYHAGPLLFGDWGTSRLYVLGLAFFYTAHASVLYLAAMSVVMVAVAWAYTVVCRCFPEGGGVYSAARQINQVLSVVGATLLLCGYIITAAISTIEAFHYFGVPGSKLVVALSIATIAALGAVNWFGARSAGRLALVIAAAAILASIVVAILSIPFIESGLRTMSLRHDSAQPAWMRWQSLVGIMLALSGVEAVSNMTGLMKEPVERTAARTIWPVLIEVVVFNLIFGIALAGLPALVETTHPDYLTHIVNGAGAETVPNAVREYRDTAMRVLSIEAAQRQLGETVGLFIGKGAAIIFGLLLLSASNTAIMAMVSVVYSLARDRELPPAFARLNYSGVPWLGLVAACLAPALVLLVVHDVMLLAELYAVGVVGAITINVLSCVVNKSLPIKKWERATMLVIGAGMLAVELTIIFTKGHAAFFAGGLVACVVAGRYLFGAGRKHPQPILEPTTGWLAEIRLAPTKVQPGRSRIMLAARGRDNAEFAVGLARKRGAVLFALYVRTLRIMDVRPGQIPRLEDDPIGQEALGTAALLARQAGVSFFPIYVTAIDIADEILDYTVTFGCDTLILGKSRRSLFSRAIAGDVVSRIAQHLPEGVALIARTSGAPAHEEPKIPPLAPAPPDPDENDAPPPS